LADIRKIKILKFIKSSNKNKNNNKNKSKDCCSITQTNKEIIVEYSEVSLSDLKLILRMLLFKTSNYEMNRVATSIKNEIFKEINVN